MRRIRLSKLWRICALAEYVQYPSEDFPKDYADISVEQVIKPVIRWENV
jgi:hypothetical protein